MRTFKLQKRCTDFDVRRHRGSRGKQKYYLCAFLVFDSIRIFIMHYCNVVRRRYAASCCEIRKPISNSVPTSVETPRRRRRRRVSLNYNIIVIYFSLQMLSYAHIIQTARDDSARNNMWKRRVTD